MANTEKNKAKLTPLVVAGQDTFAFGAGISVNDITFAYEDWGDASPKFKLYYGHTSTGSVQASTGSGQASDVISILNGERGAIEQFRFADGSKLQAVNDPILLAA